MALVRNEYCKEPLYRLAAKEVFVKLHLATPVVGYLVPTVQIPQNYTSRVTERCKQAPRIMIHRTVH